MRDILSSFFLALTLSVAYGAEEIDFAHEIVPILKQHCGKCHAGTQRKGGFSINSRESLLAGGESEAKIAPSGNDLGEFVRRISSSDESLRMPPEGEPLGEKQIAKLKQWAAKGMPWQEGFTFGVRAYEPSLTLRKIELPPASEGREHPIDRLLDREFAKQQQPRPIALSDEAFLRRASLDLIGLLPTPEELDRFAADQRPDRRARLIAELLAREEDYAEHWLSFWNDLLRNDYAGTGFITGGRKQISKWLYEALVSNMPYDQMARELIAPSSAESVGFGEGIRWRGEVSAGQTVEIQFAQSMGQAFLGINLKCASCHDSFIDRWTLEEAYGLAAVFAQQPLELHRCDQPLGKKAKAAWLFPKQGTIDPQAAQPARLKQMASLMTAPENARFSRTIVNRLWQRLMGRGIVHPIDAMQMEPWNEELLDLLATNLIENRYDLKKTLEFIATSEAYRARAESLVSQADEAKFVYRGPRAKRLSAEQFVDAVWQITGAAPTRFDAPIVRGRKPAAANETAKQSKHELTGRWIWSREDTSDSLGGETVTFRTVWNLKGPIGNVLAVVSCDNSYTLYVNEKLVQAGENWEDPDLVSLGKFLKAGENRITIVAKNGGSGANPAGLIFEARSFAADGTFVAIGSDAAWKWTSQLPDAKGRFKNEPSDWKPAALLKYAGIWDSRIGPLLGERLESGASGTRRMVRASLLKSDFLMRSLGRPNRDQIVSVRPAELSTLEAIDLSNGETLASALRTGAKHLAEKKFEHADDLTRHLYRFALSRSPTEAELAAIRETMPTGITEPAIEDALWSILLLPEFMLVR